MSDADFEVDLTARTARHTPTGTVFSFYEYRSDEDWAQAMPSAARMGHDSPSGDALGHLSAAAQRAAVAAGMKATR